MLKTPAGDIPVFNNVREGLDAGHTFNTGVVYLPPSGVRDGVAELIRVNPDLRKIVIITEKIAVHDAREIRAMAQANGVDVIGGNCLGVADSWNRVRIGGALGGDHPDESLIKGSVAIFSNSGGFTTTIAQYLGTAGWGTTTLVSSGKDLYIHYACPDFARAFAADDRSAAAVLYAEPGGYYEHGIEWTKPVVACVVGRWKSKLTRAVGHAGAMAGSGDRAEDKERWFMEAFGVASIFTPDNPVVSKKGAVVTNIADIPAALTAVMALNGVEPDFAPRGNLALKPWLGNDQGLRLPAEIALPLVTAPEPYAAQIATLGRQVGAVVARQTMKDKSGASVMDPKTQVTSVHGHEVLDLALLPLEACFALPLVHEIADENDRAHARRGGGGRGEPRRRPDPGRGRRGARRRQRAERGDGDGGGDRRAEARRAGAGLHAGADRPLRAFGAEGRAGRGLRHLGIVMDEATRALFLATPEEADDPRPEAMLAAIEARGGKSAFLNYLNGARRPAVARRDPRGIATTIAWGPLMRKRITRLTAETLPWYLRLYGVMVGATIPGEHHKSGSLYGISRATTGSASGRWRTSASSP